MPLLTPGEPANRLWPVMGRMKASLQIIPLERTRRNVRRFLQVPYALYAGDPHWVAPLLMDLEKVFQEANPLFEHAEMQLWVARRDGRDVGRIAGILEQLHNRMHGERTVFFGFFECIHDQEVADRLLGAVEDWARGRGMNQLLGPMNPTTNDECGLLVEGFDSPPVFMMTYNPRYYAGLVESAGFARAKDLLAYDFDLANTPMSRFERIWSKFQKREPEIRIEPVLKKTLERQLTQIQHVYNEAWEENWGFVPMTDAEIQFMAARLKLLRFQRGLPTAQRPAAVAGPVQGVALSAAVEGAEVLSRAHLGGQGVPSRARHRGGNAHPRIAHRVPPRVQAGRILLDPRGQHRRATRHSVVRRRGLQAVPALREGRGGLKPEYGEPNSGKPEAGKDPADLDLWTSAFPPHSSAGTASGCADRAVAPSNFQYSQFARGSSTAAVRTPAMTSTT